MKGLPRFYSERADLESPRLELEPEHRHHLERVLRKRPGDRFVLLDGRGKARLCELQSGGQARNLEDWTQSVPTLTPRVNLGLALCKGSRFEEALESLAELGVHRVFPLHTRHTQRKDPSPSRLARWQEIARSASAVANRLVPMQVEAPLTLDEWQPPGQVVCCHPDGRAAGQVFASSSSEFTLLIGPEGGFSEDEVARFPVRLSLGPLNLRVGTAAVCAAWSALSLTPTEGM